MAKLIARLIICVIFATALASVGVSGNAAVLQTLYAVLGIVFSISMSLLVSFNTSRILNKIIRKRLRLSLSYCLNMWLFDFGASTVVLVAALIWNRNDIRLVLWDWCVIDVMLIAITTVTVSLLYEIYNFRRLYKTHTDIEDLIIAEDVAKRQ